MNYKTLIGLSLLVASLCLSACGQKGPLYLPKGQAIIQQNG